MAEQPARRKLRELFTLAPSCLPSMINLALQDAATFDADTGAAGCCGAIRFSPAMQALGLQQAIDLLEVLRKDVPGMGFADLVQLAAVAAIEYCGGPSIPFRLGRRDAAGPVQEALHPLPHHGLPELRAVFGRMGLTDHDLVTLMGARSIGGAEQDPAGRGRPWTQDPFKFDNTYFRHLLADADGNLLRLPSDAALTADADTRALVQAYAADPAYFTREYVKAHTRMSELGVWARGTLGDVRARLGDLYKAIPCAPLMIRYALHDAATWDYQTGQGGADGTIRFPQALEAPENAGLGKARDLLEALKQEFPDVSHADLYQLAGVVAVAFCHGPKIPFRFGRRDAPADHVVVGRFPEQDSLNELRQAFGRMGFSDVETVALRPAFALESRVRQQPQAGARFDNSFFKDLLDQKRARIIPVAADQELVRNPETRRIVAAFAGNNDLFLEAYARAHEKLSELGRWEHQNSGLEELAGRVERVHLQEAARRRRSSGGGMAHPSSRFEHPVHFDGVVGSPGRGPQPSPGQPGLPGNPSRWKPKGGTMPHPGVRYEPPVHHEAPAAPEPSAETVARHKRFSNPDARGFHKPGTMPHPGSRFELYDEDALAAVEGGLGQGQGRRRSSLTKRDVIRQHAPGSMPHKFSRYEVVAETVPAPHQRAPGVPSPQAANPHARGRCPGGTMPHPAARFESPTKVRLPPGGRETAQASATSLSGVRVLQSPGGNSQVTLS